MVKNYRLYIDSEYFVFDSLEKAKARAQEYFKEKAELRIEYLFETEDADFWAYDYESKEWVPS